MKHCSRCGAPLRDDAQFCPSCGARIVTKHPVQHPVQHGNPQSGALQYSAPQRPASARPAPSARENAEPRRADVPMQSANGESAANGRGMSVTPSLNWLSLLPATLLILFGGLLFAFFAAPAVNAILVTMNGYSLFQADVPYNVLACLIVAAAGVAVLTGLIGLAVSRKSVPKKFVIFGAAVCLFALAAAVALLICMTNDATLGSKAIGWGVYALIVLSVVFLAGLIASAIFLKEMGLMPGSAPKYRGTEYRRTPEEEAEAERRDRERQERAEQREKEERRLQKKLIPVNIAVILIALTAGLSLLFAPLVEFDLGKAGSAAFEVMDTVLEIQKQQAEKDPAEQPSEPGQISPEEYAEKMMSAFSGILPALDGIKITVSTQTIATFAFSSAPFEDLVRSLVSWVDSISDTLIDSIVPVVIDSAVDAMTDMGMAGLEGLEIDGKEYVERIRSIENAKTSEEAYAIIDDLCDDVFAMVEQVASQQNPEFGPEEKEQMREQFKTTNTLIKTLYDETVKHNNGKFTIEAAVCVNVSGAMWGETDEEGNMHFEAVYTTYDTLVEALLEEYGEQMSESFSQAIRDLEQNGIQIPVIPSLGEDGVLDISGVFRIFALLSGVPVWLLAVQAGLWFLLAIFAFVHLFLRNKRFTMWYVKLWAFWPGLLLWGLPTAAFAFGGNLIGIVMPGLGAEMTSVAVKAIAGMGGAFASFAWISLLCYGLLWLVSVFWAFPIKRKIRMLK